MNTDYRKTDFTPLQKQMAHNYYEQNIEKLVMQMGGNHIYYENHIDWWEWGIYQEYETIRQMSFEDAAKYVIEWLQTRDRTFYSSSKYTEMLNSMLSASNLA